MRRLVTAALTGLPVLAIPALLSADPAARPVDYRRDVRPLLAQSCYACHGPDAAQRKAKLRLDVRSEAIRTAVVPGKPDASPLLERLTSTDPDEVMPPPGSKKPSLTADQVALIRRWVAEGAKFEDHWAFVKPVRTPVPPVHDPGWAINPVDAFVAAGHEAHGLAPAPEADRVTLIRRLSFDLLGLPPSPEEADAFAADRSPDAYRRLVDRLLASPQFGERMAVYWLDLVRYADTGGYHSDNHRDVSLYRDYVIDAFNGNKPFDRFTTEQIAGDLLPGAGNEQRIASGYNRLLQTTEEGGAQAKEYTAKYTADRVRNASSVWMAATLGCGECHDHKYDPYKQRDFYRFAAFFADVREYAVGHQEQTPIFFDKAQEERVKRLDALLGRLRADVSKPALAFGTIELRREAAMRTVPTTLVSMTGPPRPVRILPRGNWLDDSGQLVTPDVPAFLGSVAPAEGRAGRLDLARWITSPDNPLTARVFVNRLWKLTFGHGLVRTPDDFGTQGAPPTHPELLDWLATEFVRTGWDVKAMVRLLVTSRTYRQSSAASTGARELDPGNLWLARQNRFRLDAEFVRDNALAVSGLLTRQLGGPSVKPYQPAGYWSFLNFPRREWENTRGPGQYRRGLYTYWCRSFLHPSLAAFDAPSREECTVERPRSSTPLQALVLLNDPTYLEAARVLAAGALRSGGPSTQGRTGWAFRQVLARRPRRAEAELLTRLVEKHLAEYRADPDSARKILTAGDSPAPPDADPAELAAWTSAARVILNLHETITRP